MIEVNSNKINTFLYYGYFPDPQIPLPESIQNWLERDLSISDYSRTNKSSIILEGIRVLRKNFQQEITNDSNKLHLIPLSGGLDSRGILVNLLEHFETSKIITVTFGLPGSRDYEMAQSIAKKVGVKWEGMDLSPHKWKWSTDLLIKAAKLSQRPTRVFDNAINHSIQLKFGKDPVYWSGFMGDSLGCLDPISKKIKTWEDAKEVFVKKNCNCKKFILSEKKFNPKMQLPDQPYYKPFKLDYYSQLNHFIRQQCLTKHIYSPKGYDIRYPYLGVEWTNFMLSITPQYSLRQFLYRKILHTTWPHLFSWWNSITRNKSKLEVFIKSRGQLRNSIRKSLPKLIMGGSNNHKYLNWNYSLRFQDDFKSVVYYNLQDLRARKIIDWLDIENLWTTHQNKKNDLASELMTLAALEIHLKANTIKLNV